MANGGASSSSAVYAGSEGSIGQAQADQGKPSSPSRNLLGGSGSGFQTRGSSRLASSSFAAAAAAANAAADGNSDAEGPGSASHGLS